MAATKAMGPALIAVALLINVAKVTAADTYTNHTVGGGAGWYFNSTTNKTSADYNAWAAKKTFNLGDYLIFNTNTNQTVIQTYNKTTFDSCLMDDALDTDTFQYASGADEFGIATTIAVPLTLVGTQYYFSDADDGEQCNHEMAFAIKVNRGAGLPPNLNQPPPPHYAPPPGVDDEGRTPPVQVVGNTPNDGMKISTKFLWLVLGVLAFLA